MVLLGKWAPSLVGTGVVGSQTTVKRLRMELSEEKTDPEVERWRSFILAFTVIFG